MPFLEGPKVLVHGGGKKASEVMSQMGILPKMIDGRRVTDAQSLEIVTMVYAGLINKNIVTKLQKYDCNAIGLSGADANVILAKKRPSDPIDYGFAGDVQKVNAEALTTLIEGGMTPVFCAITHDDSAQLLNTNADTIASAVSKGLSQNYTVSLWYCFEKKGVLLDINDEDSVVECINYNKYQTFLKDGVIADGMKPKMLNVFEALKKNGVKEVKIGHPDMVK